MRPRYNYSYVDLGDTLNKKKYAPQDHHSALIFESLYRSHSNLGLCCGTLVCKRTSGWLHLHLLSMIPQFHQAHLRHSLIAAAAKSLQSCLTLCDPIDGSPPGSPVPGILQARTLEWVAISVSNAWKWKVKAKSLSCVQLLATPWTAAD